MRSSLIWAYPYLHTAELSATAEEISLLIFKDQSESIGQQQQTTFNTNASVAATVILVVGVILGLIWGAFGQIKVAIDVLRGMAQGI